MDNEMVYVPLNKGLIEITGGIQRPDQYEVTREKSLYDIIKLAGGYTKGALMTEPIKVIRYGDGTKEVIDVGNRPEDLKNFEIKTGDVYYVPQKLVEGTKFDYTIGDIPGDQLFLLAYDDQVYVIGGVAQPGPVNYAPSFTIRQYIASASGFTRMAKRKKVSIVDQQGNSQTVELGSMRKMNPGETIIVKERRMGVVEWSQFSMGLATFSLSILSAVFAFGR